MKKLRAAVVGVGYLGRFHAQKYASLKNECELVAVCDLGKEQAQKVGQELGVQAFFNWQDLVGKVDVVTVATITSAHYEVAKNLLNSGIHLLVEKPLAATSQQAAELVDLAQKKGVILQVGHIERFNPVFELLKTKPVTPTYVEARRLAPFKLRALDVDALTDLMIHDIDLMLNVIPEEITSIQASGEKVLTSMWDVAHAHFSFKSGRKAHIEVNRCFPTAIRSISVYSDRSHYHGDLGAGTLSHVSLKTLSAGQPADIVIETPEKKDALFEETRAFLSAVNGKGPVRVTGAEGLRAIQVLEQVLGKL